MTFHFLSEIVVLPIKQLVSEACTTHYNRTSLLDCTGNLRQELNQSWDRKFVIVLVVLVIFFFKLLKIYKPLMGSSNGKQTNKKFKWNCIHCMGQFYQKHYYNCQKKKKSSPWNAVFGGYCSMELHSFCTHPWALSELQPAWRPGTPDI